MDNQQFFDFLWQEQMRKRSENAQSQFRQWLQREEERRLDYVISRARQESWSL
ncbi:hypothetical protein OGX74_22165 [Citrobacter sp. CK197]|uniref:hypothetical protein n=1 Tax=Citrobacter TaxID=544 RepID=UPI0019034495|nr:MULTISPECIES: hypothetical protein [Citrobacter]EKX8765492.1 hypothetical protein [Citrobacter koseri]MBJ9645254.1 hypothetical protein [Citrobacter koseri]MDM2984100.1 hypothetical protein [Citrobacter sp. CK197]MDM3008701.1 hypothetical protein [Citrobacter sp. CK191]HBC9089306.1 hypothetical protein [Citrobacter koseri]